MAFEWNERKIEEHTMAPKVISTLYNNEPINFHAVLYISFICPSKRQNFVIIELQKKKGKETGKNGNSVARRFFIKCCKIEKCRETKWNESNKKNVISNTINKNNENAMERNRNLVQKEEKRMKKK